MKTQKLLVSATIVCLMMGASSAAMARNDCPNGLIQGGTFVTIVINETDATCTIQGVRVTGDENGNGVIVRDAGEIIVQGSTIKGAISIRDVDRAVIVKDNIIGSRLAVIGGGTSEIFIEGNYLSPLVAPVPDIVVRGPANRLNVLRNYVANGDVTVVDGGSDTTAEVIGNVINGGALKVNRNGEAVVMENIANPGTIACNNNQTLFSRNNYADEVDCGRNL